MLHDLLTHILRRVYFLLPALFLLISFGPQAHAQARYNADSAIAARKQALEMTRAAQKRTLDSTRAARQQTIDSIRAARKIITDSLQARREYRESRRFRDSVTDAREERIAAIRAVQQARMDSMKDARMQVTDSIRAVREAATASLKSAQKHRSDSLGAIRKYRASKRFTDSVAIYRQNRLDSIRQARKEVTDSMTTARKAALEEVKTLRKITTDSLAAIRKIRSDSLDIVRKAKAAEIAKKKDNRLRDKKIREKETEKKNNLAIELKIKKKRSVYSNENMLKKKWSAPRRAFQNTYTHYNYYFNANRKMEEAEANMLRSARDNWDNRIPLFSFDPLKDSTVFAADMDSVIQKVSLGIQIHDPRTKWGDDLYLLLGKAYYYKGDPDNASSSFRYIMALREREKVEAAKKAANSNKTARSKTKEAPSFVTPDDKNLMDKLKRDPANNEGLLWLARTYSTFGRLNDAESVLDLMGSDPKFPKTFRGRLALEKAFLAIQRRNDAEAATQLAIVSADKSMPVDVRRRAAYLDGQLLQEAGKYNEAANEYALVSDLHPKIDMDFYARRNRAYALMQSGGVQKDAIASLKSMLNDGKFSTYYEQIYYVLGRLSANSGDNAGAVAYLQEGISAPKSTKKQKAVSFAAMGNIHFSTGEYALAKNAYDSSNRLSTYAPDDSGVILASRRSLVVDKIAEPAGVIRQQDSLLALGAMSEKEQRAVIRRYIKALQTRKADSTFRAENAGIAAAAGTNDGSGEAASMSWYFANPTMMMQGMNEFKRKWGSRPETDNWRRSAALAAAGNKMQANPTTANDGGNADASGLDESGLPTEEALFAYIPSSAEDKATAVSRLQRAYVDMSTAYIRQFEDYDRASVMLDTLNKRWSTNPYGAEATYLRYLIALRRNNLIEAQTWSAKLQSEFPDTEWADLVAPVTSSGEASGPITASVGEYYDFTYELLQQRRYGEVLERTRNARRQFNADDRYSNRFRIMEAMAYAGSAQYSEADTILNAFIRTHANDPLRPWAEQVLSYVTERKKTDTLKAATAAGLPVALTAAAIVPPSGIDPAMPRSLDTAALPLPANYEYRPQETHFFVFAVNKMEPRAMGVKAGLGDLNTFKFASSSLETEIEPMAAGKAIVVVRSFKNAAAAKQYMAQFLAAKTLVREFQPNEYQTFVISASNFRKMFSDGGVGGYLPFYRTKY